MTPVPPPRPDHARITYDALADFYDLFTAHHDYDRWTADLERVAITGGLQGTRLLDVACGTGKSLLPFAERGYQVMGCDISPEMVRRAAGKVGPGVRLEVADMRELPRFGSFDLVCCLDDAFNYLLTDADLAAALTGLRRNLAPGGVAILDVNSVRSYRTFYASLSVVPSPDRVVIWDGRTPTTFTPGGLSLGTLELLRRRDDGTWQRQRADHHHRHHPQPLLQRAVTAAGLRCTGVYGMQLDGTVNDDFAEGRNSKAVLVLRHADAP